MPSLADALSKESVHQLHQAFVDGVLELPETPKGDIGLTQKTFDQVGIPILRYMHYRLMRDAKSNPGELHPEFPYRSTASLGEIMKEEGIEGPEKRHGNPRLIGDAARILQQSGIALHDQRGRIGGYWYLKPWDEEKVEYFAQSHTVKIDPKVEKRIEEESGTPVNSKIDLRSIKRPDPDPKSVMEFIERFVPAALKVQDKYEVVHADLQAALERIADLEAQLEVEEDKEQWRGVGSKLDNLLGQ